jgi:prepilin-type N-terminal cleavage/methylation domain-containing protein
MRNQSRQRGFTLLEVAISIGIIALISGAIFAIVQGVFSVTQRIEYGWNRHQQIYRFSELMRTTFREMPADAVVIYEDEEWNGIASPTLILRGASIDLGGASSLSGEWETVLQGRQQRGGRMGLYIFQRPIPGSRAAQEYLETEAIELLPDLIYVNWEFREANGIDWLTVWRDTGQRPVLVRLEIMPLETETSNFYTYWLSGSATPSGNSTINRSSSP